MRVLFFDTETTGVPTGPIDPATWPSIVQIAFLMVDTDKNDKHTEHDFIIKFDGAIENAHIHGITERRNKVCGHDFKDVYAILQLYFDEADMVVAHNIDFDLKMLHVECLRSGIEYKQPTNQYCTMKRCTDMCGIYKNGRLKWPTLTELHEFLFDEGPPVAHEALADVYSCVRCFYKVFWKKNPPKKFCS
jgi:DNA polymerase III epsilon subunit-like protein